MLRDLHQAISMQPLACCTSLLELHHDSLWPLVTEDTLLFVSIAELYPCGRLQQYGGYNKQYQHHSSVLGCDMKFSVYTPPAAESSKVPASTYPATG